MDFFVGDRVCTKLPASPLSGVVSMVHDNAVGVVLDGQTLVHWIHKDDLRLLIRPKPMPSDAEADSDCSWSDELLSPGEVDEISSCSWDDELPSRIRRPGRPLDKVRVFLFYLVAIAVGLVLGSVIYSIGFADGQADAVRHWRLGR